MTNIQRNHSKVTLLKFIKITCPALSYIIILYCYTRKRTHNIILNKPTSIIYYVQADQQRILITTFYDF